jgi:hypothetical protein
MEQPNGACDKALAEATTQFRHDQALSKLREIRGVMNGWENLSFHQYVHFFIP